MIKCDLVVILPSKLGVNVNNVFKNYVKVNNMLKNCIKLNNMSILASIVDLQYMLVRKTTKKSYSLS